MSPRVRFINSEPDFDDKAPAASKLIFAFWSFKGGALAYLNALALLVVLVGSLAIEILMYRWHAFFLDALAQKNAPEFMFQLSRSTAVSFVYVAAGVLSTYLQELIEIRWRQRLTHDLLCSWLSPRTTPSLIDKQAAIDNIDQRISEDSAQFVIVGSSRVDLQACKLEYSIVSPK